MDKTDTMIPAVLVGVLGAGAAAGAVLVGARTGDPRAAVPLAGIAVVLLAVAVTLAVRRHRARLRERERVAGLAAWAAAAGWQ
ncbi:MAG: hypothetical protein WCA46_09430, partial [Actinocatenispora sp.]